MASKRDLITGQVTVEVQVSPDVVDAGTEITLRCQVSCSPPADLRGHTLSVRDAAGAEVGSVELVAFDGRTTEANELVLKAPPEPGTYQWSVVCPGIATQGASYAEASGPISFTVKPHSISIVVWDVPSAIVIGERFRVKVGIKCSGECRLAHADFGIYDDKGAQIASGTLPDDCWSGTALRVAEVELEAPDNEGLYTWSVQTPSTVLGTSPHAEASTSFAVTFVGRPEFVVRVEAIDQVTRTPLTGARVVMHPYRVLTDERGTAEVRVPKGTYKLFVSQTTYLTFALPLEVTADTTARAELQPEPVLERN
jgi:hypothetical protein